MRENTQHALYGIRALQDAVLMEIELVLRPAPLLPLLIAGAHRPRAADGDELRLHPLRQLLPRERLPARRIHLLIAHTGDIGNTIDVYHRSSLDPSRRFHPCLSFCGRAIAP